MSTQTQINRPKPEKKLNGATNMALAKANRNQNEINKLKKKTHSLAKRRQKKGTRYQYKGKNQMVKQMMSMPHICTVQYASALADPEYTPAGACIPWGYPVPSQRCKSFIRGTFNLGTSGIGYIYTNLAITNDAVAVQFTTSTSVGGSSTALDSFTNTSTASYTKLPYTNAQVNSTTKGRLVAQCLKVRYAGTEANRNGIVTTVESPTNQEYLNTSTYSNINQFSNTQNERPPPDGSWHVVKYTGPTAAGLAAFDTGAQYAGNTGYLLAIISGTAGDKYEYETFVHTEYTGQLATGVTMSHSDPEGYGQVVEAMKSVSAATPLNNINSKSAFSEFLSSAGSTIWNVVKNYGMDMAMSAISPALLPASRTVRMLTG